MRHVPPALHGLTPEQVAAFYAGLPEHVLTRIVEGAPVDSAPVPGPAEQAMILDDGYKSRPHIDYLSARLAQATADVEAGTNRLLRVSMPPRSGKSVLTSIYLPVWLLAKHPDWKLGLISHDPVLASAWGREVRSTIEANSTQLGVAVARDAGAVSNWQTTSKGGVVARSAPGQSLTGRGFKVLIIDDVVRDFAAAHSEKVRNSVWEWWTSNAFTRLEPPYLVIVVGTRWHQDDLIGRLASSEYAGNPDDWEVIEFPAIAETADVLGRAPGDPLYSPLLEETREEAIARWLSVQESVGSYSFAALYQQRPSAAQGAIFDVGWWHYWTVDPANVSDTVHLFDPDALAGGTWLDSWDLSFKGADASDFVVGQRWCRVGPYRLLVDQTRARRDFTGTLAEMRRWADPHLTGWAQLVHRRLVEDKANGPAIIDTLQKELAGIKPVNPRTSKESRMRAVTPEVESGHVLLPYPGDPGNEWVTAELLPELREAPNGMHDDQVDALTQALMDLRTVGGEPLGKPSRPAPPGGLRLLGARQETGRAAAARTTRRRG